MNTAKYSVLRKVLDLKPEKDEQNIQAALTHYLHCGEEQYSSLVNDNGLEIYKSKIKELKNKENSFDLRLDLNWDIPFPAPIEPKFTFIDLFAGIGGIRIAYQREGGKCVFSSEWNKYAKITYEANFGEVPFGDITTIDEKFIPDHDILLGGFPCQPFSIAGVSKKNALGRAHGFLDETQGTLFFDIARIIDYKRPKAFMLENVKNLVSHDKGNTFKIISKTLRELHYSIYFKVLDSKHFVPQHRERIIIVGFNDEIFGKKEQFEFPELPEPTRKVKEILDPAPDNKYTLTNNLWLYLQNYAKKHKEKGNGFGFGLVDLEGITRTISARYYKDGSEALIPQIGKIPRRLTPRECARLQGYPEEFTIPVSVSDMQAYKQFGNSVTVPLIQEIGKSLIKTLLSYHEFTKA